MEFFVIRRCLGFFCFDVVGGLFVIFFLGNELEGFVIGELDIGVGGGVVLEFVVGVDVVSDVLGFGVGWCVRGVGEGVLLEDFYIVDGWGVDGSCEGEG